MPKSDNQLAQARAEIEAVNEALRNGAPPASLNKKVKCAAHVAADTLGADRRRFVPRVGTPNTIGKWEKQFSLKPDWALWLKPIDPIELRNSKKLDPIDELLAERRELDEVSSLKAKVRALSRRLIKAEELRSSVAGLFQDPPQPAPFPKQRSKSFSAGEIPLLNLYDLHWGEVIDLQRMDGVNSYNRHIAAARLARAFDAAIDLCTNHWHGPKPPKAYIVLGGDLVSGNIHDELRVTNDLSPPEAVRELVGYLKFHIARFQKALGCPIEVLSIPGNHGRLSDKAEPKRYVSDSWDTLVAWLLEAHFNEPGSPVTISVPLSGDALVNIYGRNVLWTHGDRIGTRGSGIGSIAGGMRKVFTEYAARGISLYTIIMGHVHTSLELEDGFVSGPLSGFGEYPRDKRYKPAQATQWLLTMHPVWGIAQRWKLFVGDPSEGSIYGGKE